MSVRIIAGQWGGRRLAIPPENLTRPLTDRIKQSLFDRLGQWLDGLRVADVCAGSGSFGIEAASRGATEVHLIENGKPALQVIRANLKSLGNPSQVHTLPLPFQRALPSLANLDLIYADPPFPWFHQERALLDQLCALCSQALAPGGQFLLRGEEHQAAPNLAPELQLVERISYGRSWVIFCKKPEATSTGA